MVIHTVFHAAYSMSIHVIVLCDPNSVCALFSSSFWTSEISWIDNLRSSYNIDKRDNTVQLDCGDTSCVFALSAFKHRVKSLIVYTETPV